MMNLANSISILFSQIILIFFMIRSKNTHISRDQDMSRLRIYYSKGLFIYLFLFMLFQTKFERDFYVKWIRMDEYRCLGLAQKVKTSSSMKCWKLMRFYFFIVSIFFTTAAITLSLIDLLINESSLFCYTSISTTLALVKNLSQILPRFQTS